MTSKSEIEKAAEGMLTAVKYKAPPVDFGTQDEPNLCYEARIPIEFVEKLEAALRSGHLVPAESGWRGDMEKHFAEAFEDARLGELHEWEKGDLVRLISQAAQITPPNATPDTRDEEIARLRGALEMIRQHYSSDQSSFAFGIARAALESGHG